MPTYSTAERAKRHPNLGKTLALKVVSLLRTSRGWSQEKTARKVGVSFKTIIRWEKGQSSPSPMAIDAVIDLAVR